MHAWVWLKLTTYLNLLEGIGRSWKVSVVPAPASASGSLAAVSVWPAESLCTHSSTGSDRTCRFETSIEGRPQVSQL